MLSYSYSVCVSDQGGTVVASIPPETSEDVNLRWATVAVSLESSIFAGNAASRRRFNLPGAKEESDFQNRYSGVSNV